MTGYLIGVDAGNTMVKAALFDVSGQTLAVAARSSETLQPAPGFVERSPEGLWQAASGAIRDCLEQAGVSGAQVLAVGAAGHGNGLYLLDREGQGLVGIQSMDNRAETLASEIAPSWCTVNRITTVALPPRTGICCQFCAMRAIICRWS